MSNYIVTDFSITTNRFVSAKMPEDFFAKPSNTARKPNEYSVHFASAREAVNMVFAAIDGKQGNPNEFRNYRLQTIMNQTVDKAENETEKELQILCS